MTDPRLATAHGLTGVPLPTTVAQLLKDASHAFGPGTPYYAAEVVLFAAITASLLSWRTGPSTSPTTIVAVEAFAQSAFATLNHSLGRMIDAGFGTLMTEPEMVRKGGTKRMTTRRSTASASASRRAIGRVFIATVAIIAAVIVAGAVVYIATVSTGPSTVSTTVGQQSSGPPAVHVSIYSGAANSANPPGYTPDVITLVIGINNTVTWTNNDSAHHTVTSTSAPSGASFNSGNMNGGATYTHTFTVAGAYKYDCVYHYWMTGTVIVKADT
jgi:plastocyanin